MVPGIRTTWPSLEVNRRVRAKHQECTGPSGIILEPAVAKRRQESMHEARSEGEEIVEIRTPENRRSAVLAPAVTVAICGEGILVSFDCWSFGGYGGGGLVVRENVPPARGGRGDHGRETHDRLQHR